MKQEQVIELAKQAGFPFNKYGLLQGDEEWEIEADEMFTRFASLVEQATLERAATIAEEAICDCCWGDGATGAAEHIADEIRNLAKDTQ